MKRYFEQVMFTLRSKWNFLVFSFYTGVPIIPVLLYDLDKFLPSQIKALSKFFDKVDKIDLDENMNLKYEYDMIVARFEHTRRNKHHWEHWIMMWRGQVLAMPMGTKYCLQMITAWLAVDRTISRSSRLDAILSTYKWYQASKNEFVINDDSLKFIDGMMNELYYYYESKINEPKG